MKVRFDVFVHALYETRRVYADFSDNDIDALVRLLGGEDFKISATITEFRALDALISLLRDIKERCEQ